MFRKSDLSFDQIKQLKLQFFYQKWDLTQLKDHIKTCKFKFNEDFDIKLI